MKKFWQSNKQIFKFILIIFVFWQTAIIGVSLLSSRILPARERFMYNDGEKIINPKMLWSRANFDGIYYLGIAKNGYGFCQQALFPLYPKLIRFFTPFFGNRNLIAGLFISNLSILLSTFIFYKLISLDFEKKTAKWATLFLFFFPTSFFFGAIYSESFFLLAVLGSFYAARKQHWLLAGILGGLASYTRLMGIFLFPALLFEWWMGRQARKERWEIGNLLKIFLVPVGLLAYISFLWQRYAEPLMFLRVQSFFVAQKEGKIILIYQVFWRYFKMILTTRFDPLYFAVWLELLTAIGFLLLLVTCIKKKIRLSYLIFAFLVYIVPALSGTFSSLPRYALIMFPCFIILGTIKRRFVKIVLLLISILIFIISSGLFFRGYWIS